MQREADPRYDHVPDGKSIALNRWGDAYSRSDDPYQGLPIAAAERLAQSAQHTARARAAQDVADEERRKAKALMHTLRVVDRLSVQRIATANGLSRERIVQITKT